MPNDQPVVLNQPIPTPSPTKEATQEVTLKEQFKREFVKGSHSANIEIILPDEVNVKEKKNKNFSMQKRDCDRNISYTKLPEQYWLSYTIPRAFF